MLSHVRMKRYQYQEFLRRATASEVTLGPKAHPQWLRDLYTLFDDSADPPGPHAR
jgi:hypothetical protein